MAEIQQYLDDIQEAVYGREVRKSIHDAIEAINNDIEEYESRELDPTVTNPNLAPQARQVYRLVDTARTDSHNRNKYLDRPEIDYINIIWRNVGINEDTGAEIPYSGSTFYKYLSTDYLARGEVDALEISKFRDIGFSIWAFRYDANKNFITLNKYKEEHMDDTDIIMLPSKPDFEYLRLMILSTSDEDNVFAEGSIGVTSVRGIKRSRYERFEETEQKTYVPVLFGRGTLFRSGGALQDSAQSNKNVLKTDYIKTSDVDVVTIDRSSVGYRVDLYYFDANKNWVSDFFIEKSRDISGFQVSKQYSFFRIKIVAETATDVSTARSPYDVMRDFKMYRIHAKPSQEIFMTNQVKAEKLGFIETYPHYSEHRRTYTDTDQAGYPRPDSDLYVWGLSRFGMADNEFIDAADVDYIYNDTDGYTVYVQNYAEANYGSWLKSKVLTASTSDRSKFLVAGAKWIRIGVVPPNSNDKMANIEPQFIYEHVHLYKRKPNIPDPIVKPSIFDVNDISDINAKLDQIRKTNRLGGSSTPIQPLVLLHFSDLHNNSTALSRVLEFRSAFSTYIHDTIHTGDTLPNANKTSCFADYPDAKYILNVIGNHDTWNEEDSVAGWTALTEEASYNKYFAPYIDNWGLTGTIVGKCYYSKDYPEQNVRLITLDYMHENADQLSWFQTALENARSAGRHVVIAHHARMANGNDMVKLNSGFMNPLGNWVLGSAKYPLNAGEEYRAAVDTFVANGGIVACWICGHHHADQLCTYHDILNIVVTTAGSFGQSRTPDVRIENSKSYDAFNIMGIDTFRKHVKVMRVGMDYNATMQHIGTFCWDYQNHVLISTN